MDEWTEDELYELMQEPSGGENHGHRYVQSYTGSADDDNPLRQGKQQLDTRQTPDYSEMGGSIISKNDFPYMGMVAHRGVLHTWEYADDNAIPSKDTEFVDVEALGEAVSDLLGEDLDEIRRIYGPGGLNDSDLVVRARMDEKFLQIYESEGNLLMLAKVLGFGIKKNNECRVMTNSLRRARIARG